MEIYRVFEIINYFLPKGTGLTISLLNVDKLVAHRKDTVYDRGTRSKDEEQEEDKRQGQRR